MQSNFAVANLFSLLCLDSHGECSPRHPTPADLHVARSRTSHCKRKERRGHASLLCKSSLTHGTAHAGSTGCHWLLFAVMLLFFARLPLKDREKDAHEVEKNACETRCDALMKNCVTLTLANRRTPNAGYMWGGSATTSEHGLCVHQVPVAPAVTGRYSVSNSFSHSPRLEQDGGYRTGALGWLSLILCYRGDPFVDYPGEEDRVVSLLHR